MSRERFSEIIIVKTAEAAGGAAGGYGASSLAGAAAANLAASSSTMNALVTMCASGYWSASTITQMLHIGARVFAPAAWAVAVTTVPAGVLVVGAGILGVSIARYIVKRMMDA